MIVNDSMTVHACALHNSGAEATRHALHFWNTAHSIGISLLLVESARKEKHHGTPKSGKRLRPATLAALGIVYGDIGTSPLYAVRECFAEPERLAINDANVLGVMSPILWSMFVGVAVKYLVFVMRADFDGEGGILALMTLARPGVSKKSRGVSTIVLLGLCGAGLLYGDGVITPAISVFPPWKARILQRRRLIIFSFRQRWRSCSYCSSFSDVEPHTVATIGTGC